MRPHCKNHARYSPLCAACHVLAHPPQPAEPAKPFPEGYLAILSWLLQIPVADLLDWRATDWTLWAPEEVGWYWFFGDEEFGTTGGNFTGKCPPERNMHVVEISRLGRGLAGICRGRLIPLRPFSPAGRGSVGYVGVWHRAVTPTPPICEGAILYPVPEVPS